MNRNGKNGGSVKVRRAKQWDDFLQDIIIKIKDKGYEGAVMKTQLERLILHHQLITKIKDDTIKGFVGIQKPRPEVERWMKGF